MISSYSKVLEVSDPWLSSEQDVGYDFDSPDPPSAFNIEEEKQKAIEEYMKSEGSMY